MDQGRDDIREVVKLVIDEFLRAQKDSVEPELLEERKKREGLEQRVNELVIENGRAKSESAIRAELQRLG